MDMHFRGKNLFIQIDFHNTVQQGFLPLLHLLQPNGILVQFFAEPVESGNFRRLNLNGIRIKKSQFKTPDRAVGEAEEQLLAGAFIVRIFRQPGLGQLFRLAVIGKACEFLPRHLCVQNRMSGQLQYQLVHLLIDENDPAIQRGKTDSAGIRVDCLFDHFRRWFLFHHCATSPSFKSRSR